MLLTPLWVLKPYRNSRYKMLKSWYLSLQTLLIDSELAVVVPYIVFAVLAFIGASTSMLLPETRGKPMPQTVAEANLLGEYVSFVFFSTSVYMHIILE